MNTTRKIGIITFHNSYNCGSMMESYAMQTIIAKLGGRPEIINFSNKGQRELYSTFFKNNSIKNVIKNLIIFPKRKLINRNNEKYVEFQEKNFILSNNYVDINELNDRDYCIIIAGSDQIWNITIADGDDAYFLPWVKYAKKVAYAPSFGAKKIANHTSEEELIKYSNYIRDFDALSIRENNGKIWIKEMIGVDVPVLLDPTLLLEESDYNHLESSDIIENEKYIFFYSPSFDRKICQFVKDVATKYNLKVITWSAKSYYLKIVKTFGFELAKYENPASYLYYIKNAELVMTTSYHGTIFSTIYRKKFITIKNGGMYESDDRVITLLKQVDMMDRLLTYNFDDKYNYLEEINYLKYQDQKEILKQKSINYLRKLLSYEDTK